jgi:excisionase family DNA binding protein
MMSLLKVCDVALKLQVSKARVYELVRLQLIPSVKVGQRQIRFDDAALQRWIACGGSANDAASKFAAVGI